MDEQEFDSLLQFRPFTTKDGTRADAQQRRRMTLAIALWGRTLDDLKSKFIALRPEIPKGFDVTDLRELQRSLQNISADLSNPRRAWLTRLPVFSQTISVGTERYTAWEVRCEIVRRAVEYLENH